MKHARTPPVTPTPLLLEASPAPRALLAAWERPAPRQLRVPVVHGPLTVCHSRHLRTLEGIMRSAPPPPAPPPFVPGQAPLFRLRFRMPSAKKPRTLGAGNLTRAERKQEKRLDKLEFPSVLARRKLPVLQMPKTRAGCASIPRPCPFIRCSKNLYLTETDDGVLKVAYPELKPWQMDPDWSCSADVAARGPALVEEVAAAFNMTDERVRQIQVGALAKLKAIPGVLEMLLAARDDDGS